MEQQETSGKSRGPRQQDRPVRPVRETYQRPASTQREHIPLPGYGDTGRGKDKK